MLHSERNCLNVLQTGLWNTGLDLRFFGVVDDGMIGFLARLGWDEMSDSVLGRMV